MPQNRLFGVAAVLAKGVCAGSIESSSGSATVTPAPRRNVRRERCFFEMKFIVPVSLLTLCEPKCRPKCIESKLESGDRSYEEFSPPLRGGVAATPIKYREVSFWERTGW